MVANEKALRWYLIASLVRPIVGLVSRINVRGSENLPKEGAFILAPCHYSAIDPVIMGLAVWKSGRVPRFMAKESLFRVPVLGPMLRWMGQIPVDRSGQQRALGPMKAAASLAKSGGGVIIYPEGSLTRDPELWPMRGKTGAVRMALDAGIPLIPAAHWGTQQLLPRYSGKLKLFPPTQIQVLIGKPIDLSHFKGKQIDQRALGQATDILMNSIAALQGQLRGEVPPIKRWNPAEHNQTTTGKFK